MNPHSYGHLIFDKVAKNMMEKRQPLQQMLGKVVIRLQKTENFFVICLQKLKFFFITLC
jgi:hypothetical protein